MEMEIKKANGVSDVGAWAMNVVSSVGIIMTNKQLMSSTGGYAFTFGNYSLSQLHLENEPRHELYISISSTRAGS
ncbi:hypothetical protein HanOQP8_Chr01g0000761 [Helianthus annuus]|nr:hypothetical protein HanOQP8_Chr01g0000761 [Helianthus annuus]